VFLVAPLIETVEIARPAAEVFAYVTDPARYHEWQKGAVRGDTHPKERGDPIGVGSIVIMTRRVGGVERTSTSEITEYDPPLRWAIRGIDRSIRADASVVVEAIDATSCRATIEIRFRGQGIGRLLTPIVVSQGRREMPQTCRFLKECLESKNALT
jgi:hypothetical protein